MSVEDALALPMKHCPCCGKEWPKGFRVPTYGEWFYAVDAAVTELGPMTAETFVPIIRRAAVIANLREGCEVLEAIDAKRGELS